MALTDGSNGLVMPVSPYNGGNGGFGGFGDSWAWILLLLVLGWGGNGFGGGGFGGGFGGDLYPWMNQANLTSNGFQNQLMNDNITEIRSGVNNLSTQLCNCCSDVQMSLANGFAGVEQGANARQMANMQTAFAGQTAMAQGFNQVSSQLADCCCENRLATANLGADIAREACATRTADAQNTQALLTTINGGIQSIKDQLCQDKIDAKNDEISQLRQEVLYARGQASQIAQNSTIIDGIYNRLNQCPVGTVPVYGEQPIFQCPQQANSCGCGCGNGF